VPVGGDVCEEEPAVEVFVDDIDGLEYISVDNRAWCAVSGFAAGHECCDRDVGIQEGM
jgi:hypothetical protein